jgi:hypothetical protein
MGGCGRPWAAEEAARDSVRPRGLQGARKSHEGLRGDAGSFGELQGVVGAAGAFFTMSVAFIGK